MGSIQTNNPHGKLTLYTNHACPWAHRAHIAVEELGLEYDEVIIELERPRDEWYLKINSRGLVPTIHHTHDAFPSADPVTVIESALVVQYLIDAFPDISGHIYPTSSDPVSAYNRYKTGLLVDTWSNKISGPTFKAQLMSGTDEAAELTNQLFEAIKTNIEPQLSEVLVAGKGPFVGGSDKFTLFEILVAPFVLRIYEFSNDLILPKSLAERLDTLPAFSKWAQQVRSRPSVTHVWNREKVVEMTQRRLPEMRKKYGFAK